MSESSSSISCRRRYEALPTNRNSSTSISSRSIRAAARTASVGGGNGPHIVFSDRRMSGRELCSAWSGVSSIRDFPYIGFTPSGKRRRPDDEEEAEGGGGRSLRRNPDGRRRSKSEVARIVKEIAGRHRVSAELTELFDCPTPIVEGVTEDKAEQIKRRIEKAHGSVKITRTRDCQIPEKKRTADGC
jgi:ribosomal protein L22